MKIGKIRLTALVASIAILFFANGAMAQLQDGVDQSAAGQQIIAAPVESEQPVVHEIGMVTGSVTGTYFRFGNDIKEAMKGSGVSINVKESTGSIENINRIASTENAGLGIVQSDVLGFMMRSEEPKSRKLAKDLRLVFPFYEEEVHVIAGKDIEKFSHLNGKIVVVGPDGSGSWLTSMNLFNLTGVRPAKLLRLSPEEGMVEVLKGRADAMIYVAGKPVKLFENLDKIIETGGTKTLEQMHFVPLDDKQLLTEYSKASITNKDYKFVRQEVPTIAVTAILVSHDFAGSGMANNYTSARCGDIKRLSKVLSEKLPQLREKAHPKWKEVDLTADVGVWQRDKCSVADSSSRTIENELLNTMDIKW